MSISSQIKGIDLFMDYWGSPWIAHTIVSFDLGNGQHVAFSMETRKQIGQSYSAIRGFFRQYTLISVVSDERDLVRLRTNYRRGEDLYLYRTRATPAFARSLFLNYAAVTNQLAVQPQWYNAITHNCTTEIFTFQNDEEPAIRLADSFERKGRRNGIRAGEPVGRPTLSRNSRRGPTSIPRLALQMRIHSSRPEYVRDDQASPNSSASNRSISTSTPASATCGRRRPRE